MANHYGQNEYEFYLHLRNNDVDTISVNYSFDTISEDSILPVINSWSFNDVPYDTIGVPGIVESWQKDRLFISSMVVAR